MTFLSDRRGSQTWGSPVCRGLSAFYIGIFPESKGNAANCMTAASVCMAGNRQGPFDGPGCTEKKPRQGRACCNRLGENLSRRSVWQRHQPRAVEPNKRERVLSV